MTRVQRDVTTALADFCTGLRYEDLPPPVVQRTKELFLDFLGVACGGRTDESAGPLLRAVARLGGRGPDEASVVGEEERYVAHYAALLNGAFAHSQDFDDTHREAVLHPGVPVFATLLALGEATRASGRDFLTAAVVGYEVSCRLGRAHGEAVHGRGFHPTATTGVFGATAAGARLLGLGRQALLDAWGLNLSQAAGTFQFLENGAWNKRVHVGLAAHNAIVALAMAREGVTGAANPFLGRFGYYFSYAGIEPDLEAALADLGRQFEVMNTAVKPYPCCRYSHPVIDGLAELARTHGLRPEDVEAVEVGLPRAGMPVVAEPEAPKKAPANVVDAQFSVYFAAAIALLEGGFTWQSYGRLRDPAVVALMGRVRVYACPLKGLSARVAVLTRRGERFESDVPLAKGEPERPLTWEELLAKFRPLAEPVLGPAAEELVSVVEGLERVPDLTAVGRLLRPSGR